jgi:mannosyltransferase
VNALSLHLEGGAITAQVKQDLGPKPFGVIVCLTATIGIFLRWWNLGERSLWIDEGYTSWVASLAPSEILRVIRHDTGAPLHFLVLHYWVSFWGNSEVSLRALSALFGSLSVPLFVVFAMKILKNRAGVALATCLYCLSTMQIMYSRQARYYPIMSFLSLVGLYCLVLHSERARPLTFAGVVLSITLSLYTHNMMAFYLISFMGAWAILPSGMPTIVRIKEMLAANAIIGALFLPRVPSLLFQLGIVGQSFNNKTPTLARFVDTVALACGLLADYLRALVSKIFAFAGREIVTLVSLFILIPLGCLLILAFLRGSQDHRRLLLALSFFAFVPLVLVFVLSHFTKSIFTEKVFISSSVVCPILLASSLDWRRRGRVASVCAGLGLVLILLESASLIGYSRYIWKDGWRNATDYLISIPSERRLIVFVATEGQLIFDYYSSRQKEALRIEKTGCPSGFFDVDPPRAMRAVRNLTDLTPLMSNLESRKFDEVDLVLYHDYRADPNGLTFDLLSKSAVLLEKREFPEITVCRFRLISKQSDFWIDKS